MRADTPATPSSMQLVAYFLRLGATGFGGPAALADRMRADLVDARQWLSPQEFALGLAIAAACPGPLAYQLAVYCGFIRHGLAGAFGVGVAFAAVPFALVVAAAAAYDVWSADPYARAVFSGAAPVVTVLIARACWGLGRRTLHHAAVSWILCGAGAAITSISGREPLWLFLLAAVAGALWLVPATAASQPAKQRVESGPTLLGATALVSGSTSAGLFGFFFKTGCLVFGSGLVIVPVLKTTLVDERGWLTSQQFLDSVTIGLISPGPVVITATFVGYIVDRFAGALAATAGMFLPAILVTVIATPWFVRNQHRPSLTGAVRGVTATVVGVLAGTIPIVAVAAVPDMAALVILMVAALAAWRYSPADPLLVAGGASLGLLASTFR
jgi:chromate transporter